MPPIEIEGMRSLTGSQSTFFVNLGEGDAIAVAPVGEEASLLLSSSPDGFLHHSISRREHPVLIPVPSRRTRDTRWERGDCPWMLEESSPELKAHELLGEEEIQLDNDEHKDVADWRQFHVDLLQTIR